MRMFLLTFFTPLLLLGCNPNNGDTSVDSGNIKVSEAKKPVLTGAERGKVLYKRCSTCHTLKQGERHKVGPNLYAIFGATAGTKPGFAYSGVMSESGLVWTEENLDGYMENPAKFMPKNRMSFAGLRKPEDRAALLEYLKEATQPEE